MSYSFISFLRQGIANSIRNIDDLSKGGAPASTGKPRAELEVTVNVSYNGGTAEPLPRKKLELYGPGDVAGIDQRAIIRTEPQHYATNFEPNYFSFIEFYDEDFPWRFTPTIPNADGRRLTPWLALVVLEESEFESSSDSRSGSGSGPLPKFTLKDTADRAKIFPSAANLWAWAHVHVNSDIVQRDAAGGVLNDNAVTGRLKNVLDEDGDYCYSRLICPRRLSANKSYHAFLVPSFETGRLAGLGKTDEVNAASINQSSWSASQAEFPYYYRFYFRTGAMGDFEYLVDQLKPKAADSRVGYRELYVPGIEANGKEKPLYMPGALRVPLQTLSAAKRTEIENYENWEAPNPQHQWQKDIAKELRFDTATGEPTLTMPIYGMWHAQVENVLYAKNANEVITLLPARTPWVQELNLDPRYRAAAALGTKVIQKNQEELMDAAWEQVDQVREANKKLLLYQLAIGVNKVFHKNVLSHFEPGQLIGFTSSLHKLINSGSQLSATLFKEIDESVVSNSVSSNLFRKVSRNNGRVAKVGANTEHIFAAGPTELNKTFAMTPQKVLPAGAMSLNQFNTLVTGFAAQQPSFRGATINDRNRLSLELKNALVFDKSIAENLKKTRTNFVFTPGGSAHNPITGVRPATVIAQPAPVNPVTPVTPTRPVSPIRPGTPLRTDPIRNIDIRPGLTTPVNISGAAVAKPGAAQLLGIAIGNTVQVFEGTAAVKVPVKADLNVVNLNRSILSGVDAQLNLKSDFLKLFPGISTLIPSAGEWATPVMAYPEFRLPMYLPLKELSDEYFLPNINLLEQNSITLLETNQRFIEAYMAGLNHEMSRELLWRNYPTDQRGSYFRRFWDAMDEEYTDIKELHTWKKVLGENGQGGNAGLIVLVIRGDLLKKYPNTVISAQKADWGTKNGARNVQVDRVIKEGTQPVYPLFEAKIDPDIYFIGFQITENGRVVDETGLRGTLNPDDTGDDPGWFFVLQERPGEPRFGFDLNFTATKEKWSHISWQDTGIAEGSIVNFSRAISVTNDTQAAWPPKDSAQLAYILYQQPVLVAVHASRLLKQQ